MADLFPTDATLQVRYLPDDWDGKGENPHDVANPVTGFVQVGALIGGAFRPLAQFKAAGLYADMQRAQRQQQQDAEQQQTSEQQQPTPTALAANAAAQSGSSPQPEPSP